MADPVIRTRSLTKSYGTARGIVEVDLEIMPGEVFGYVGPNGAGKSTTIRTLLDLIRPTAGSAQLFGLDSHRDSVAIRRRIGYVPGELHLYESLSGRELLSFLGGLRGGVDERRLRDLAERLDLDMSRETRNLSHGNRQKLALAQALAHDPELLIMDEPTNGLDPLAQEVFRSLVAEAQDAGRTVFLSSHLMSEVERLCDRVAVIREGRIIAVERVDALKAKAVRRLEIRFATPVPETAFVGLPGVTDLVIDERVLRCATTGSLDPLMKAANRFTIMDVLANEPSLEEIILALYADGASAPTPEPKPEVGEERRLNHAA